MKKHFTAGFLCLSIIAAVCGCKSNKDITESNAYSSVVTGSVGSSTVSETEEINTAAEITNSSSSSNTSVKSEASGCKHDFRSLILPPNCTTGGYTEHRCQDCGYEYISDKTEPNGKHDYGKYLCDYCDKADPSRPIETLIVWMKKHGTESGNSKFYGIEKTVGNIRYEISTPYDFLPQNFVSFTATSLSGIDYFSVDFSDTADCRYSFKKYSEDYQTLIHADIELKSSVARAKFIPEDFSYLDIYDTSYPKEEVYIQMTDFFDEFINEINSVFASSGCGLSVKDFGFKLF